MYNSNGINPTLSFLLLRLLHETQKTATFNNY